MATKTKKEEKPKAKSETTPKESEEESETKKSASAIEKYYESVGRRKQSVARVRLYTKKSVDKQDGEDVAMITVNEKLHSEYFPKDYLIEIVESPLKKLKSLNRFKANILVKGGGTSGQADACRLGIARALIKFDNNFSKKLKRAGYITVDSRVKERKKYGLKKARKSPQWSKR